MSRISSSDPLSASSLPESAPPSALAEGAETFAVRPKTPFRDSRWRPALCCAGALGLGLSLAPLLLRPGQPAASATGLAPRPEIALTADETLVVSPQAPPGALLRGRIRLVAGETDALGRARVSGLVARHLVENGARVERGDAVMEISSGVRQRSVPASEFRQNRAEQSQIAASQAQNALAQKMALAQTQLRVAGDRVARAQKQVADARDIVRRLQNGEAVAPGEIPASFRSGKTENAARRSNRKPAAREEGASRIAARQAEAAREAAQESARALETARTMLSDVQSAARQAEAQAQTAAKAVVDVETRFDDKKATGADVEAARSAQKEAQSAVEAAGKALAGAKTEVAKREKSAASAQNYAQSSAAEAARSAANAGSNPAEASGEAPEATAPDAGSSTRVTLDNAILFAGAALEESRRASRDAERLHGQIEGYKGQVNSSNSRIEAATQDLAQAQQRVMNSVPRPRFTTSYAPASGIVTWISRLARDVGAGDPVFGIARAQRAAARFEDASGLWRSIQAGATLTAFVVNAPAAPETGSPTASASVVENATDLGVGHEIQLKMTQVEAPEAGGKAAKMTGVPLGNRGGPQLTEGAQVLVSMPRPGQKATLSVPASALVERGQIRYVALLAPLSDAEKQARISSQGAVAAASAAQPSEKALPVGNEGEMFHLRWTQVETGRNDGLRLEITRGLQAGARVVGDPEILEAMGFAPVPQMPTTILNTTGTALSDAGTSKAQSLEPVPPTDVLVRLTPALA